MISLGKQTTDVNNTPAYSEYLTQCGFQYLPQIDTNSSLFIAAKKHMTLGSIECRCGRIYQSELTLMSIPAGEGESERRLMVGTEK